MTADSRAGLVFCKHYVDRDRARAAAANHRWLTRLGAPTPRLLSVQDTRLDFERIAGRHVRPHDVPAVAELLGQLHAAAHRTALQTSTVDTTVPLDDTRTLPGFTATRIAAIRRRLAAGAVPDPRLTSDQAEQLLHAACGQAAAFYKDTNVRNVLITATGPVLVDFDDLTLAPFGYDLAKLLITTAMTHGKLPSSLTNDALATYNRAAAGTSGALVRCSGPELLGWIEIHHILTTPYLGRNGYRHSWHLLRDP